MPVNLFQWNPEDEVTTRRSTDTLGASSRNCLWFAGTLASALTLHEHLEKKAEFRASTQGEA